MEDRNINAEVLESLIFKGLYSNIPEYRQKVLNAFKDVYFDEPVASEVFNIFKGHWNEYQTLPTLTELKGKITKNSEDELTAFLHKVRDAQISSDDHLLQQTNMYLQEKALKLAIVQSVDDVENNPERVFKRIEAIKGLSINGYGKFQMTFPFNGVTYQEREDVLDKKYWLYPLVPKGGHITMLVGEKGTGKTWTALKIADTIAKNENWDIWKGYDHEQCVPSAAKVLYLDGEMSNIDLKPRLIELNTNENFIPYQYMDIANEDERDKLHNPEYRKFVLQRIIEEKFDVVILDNIISLFIEMEIMGTQDWSAVNEWLLELRMNNIFVLVIDHMGKDKSKGAIGTMSKIFNVDDVIYLTNPKGHDRVDFMKCEFKVEYTRAGGALPFEDRYLLGTRIISLQDGEWTIESFETENSTFSKKEDLYYKAMSKLIVDPDIRKVDLNDYIGKGKNFNIISPLVEERYIEITGNEGTRHERRDVTDFGVSWYRNQEVIRGETGSETGM